MTAVTSLEAVHFLIGREGISAMYKFACLSMHREVREGRGIRRLLPTLQHRVRDVEHALVRHGVRPNPALLLSEGSEIRK